MSPFAGSSGIPVVKAFNVLSAYSLSLQDPGVHVIPIASDDQRAKEIVSDLVQKMGFFPEDRGSLQMARQVTCDNLMTMLENLLSIGQVLMCII